MANPVCQECGQAIREVRKGRWVHLGVPAVEHKAVPG